MNKINKIYKKNVFSQICNNNSRYAKRFCYSSLGCDGVKAFIEPTKLLLEEARKHNVYVIFFNDSHLKWVDKELKLWGDHAIRGKKGAEVIQELQIREKDFYNSLILKRRYSSFFKTDLDLLLKELGVDTVIITGLNIHMCYRHFSADAYQNNNDIIFAKEVTNLFTVEDYLFGLQYAKEVYGAPSLSNKELFELFSK